MDEICGIVSFNAVILMPSYSIDFTEKFRDMILSTCTEGCYNPITLWVVNTQCNK